MPRPLADLSRAELVARADELRRELASVEAELSARGDATPDGSPAPDQAQERESARVGASQAPASSSGRGQQGEALEYKPLGLLRSCFKEKNGTPRQGLHAPHSRASLTLDPTGCYYVAGALEGLTDYSHVWLIFDFHANTNNTDNTMIKAKIKAPQLGGKATGLFATRTPHRPNPIGLSLCILESVSGNTITLRGVDLIDGTPILDVKPYHPMDCMVDARYPEWVAAQFPDRRVAPQIVPPLRVVELTAAAEEQLRGCLEHNRLELYSTLEEVREGLVECIRLDMRREQHRRKLGAGAGTFRFCFDLLNVTFRMTAPDSAEVMSVEYWPKGKAAHFDAAKHVVLSPATPQPPSPPQQGT